MSIRNATYKDAPAIKSLLEILGFKPSISEMVVRLENLSGRSDHQIFVYELHKDVAGFISLHYMPQLTVDRELAFIDHLSVEESLLNQGIEKALEQYVTRQAMLRTCERIEVHCKDQRSQVNLFYEQQGYQEHCKYFIKTLVHEK